ncbi:hypothetical protein PspLS_05730 [Pyricularia sp. CBS 133598]|nr:hypothetical protein PspLS_05730 [Pyricularia sp. CBS 133598]
MLEARNGTLHRSLPSAVVRGPPQINPHPAGPSQCKLNAQAFGGGAVHGCVVLKAGCPKCSTFEAPQAAENPCDRFKTISLRFNPRFRNQGVRWGASLVKEGKKGLRIIFRCTVMKIN